MKRTLFKIKEIPAVLWGEPMDRLFIAVHGNMSHKEDDAIRIFAEEATEKGFQVLSFDLPEHGDRKGEDYLCKVQNCVSDLNDIMAYAQTVSKNISLFACSMGAYFSLLTFRDLQLWQCLFLSPVLDMARIITNMMTWFQVSEERLKAEQVIETPIGQTLYWDYYSYVLAHPIDKWDKETAILYGTDDNITEFDVVSDFVKRFNCQLKTLEHGEHYFHTEAQLDYFRQWLRENIRAGEL